MNLLAIAAGIVLIAAFLLLADGLHGFFGATQIQLVYIAITILAASIAAHAFGRA